MAFGTSGRNDRAGIVGHLCETADFLSIKRPASDTDALQFLAITLVIDLSARSSRLRFRERAVKVQALLLRPACNYQPDVQFQS